MSTVVRWSNWCIRSFLSMLTPHVRAIDIFKNKKPQFVEKTTFEREWLKISGCPTETAVQCSAMQCSHITNFQDGIFIRLWSSYFPKVQQKAPGVCSLQATSQRPTRKVVTPTQLRLRQQQSWFVNILNGKIKNWICHLTLFSVTTRFIMLTLSERDGWW